MEPLLTTYSGDSVANLPGRTKQKETPNKSHYDHDRCAASEDRRRSEKKNCTRLISREPIVVDRAGGNRRDFRPRPFHYGHGLFIEAPSSDGPQLTCLMTLSAEIRILLARSIGKIETGR